jgi:hypothetical protein
MLEGMQMRVKLKYQTFFERATLNTLMSVASIGDGPSARDSRRARNQNTNLRPSCSSRIGLLVEVIEP